MELTQQVRDEYTKGSKATKQALDFANKFLPHFKITLVK